MSIPVPLIPKSRAQVHNISPEPLPIGQVLHVAATLEDHSGRQSLYVDGIRVATAKTKIRPCGPLGRRGAGIDQAQINVTSCGSERDIPRRRCSGTAVT